MEEHAADARTPQQPADAICILGSLQRLWIGLKSDPELYEWQDDIYAKCPLLGVSGPTNFVHQGELVSLPG